MTRQGLIDELNRLYKALDDLGKICICVLAMPGSATQDKRTRKHDNPRKGEVR